MTDSSFTAPFSLLVVQPNRYQAILIQREMLQRYPEAAITITHSGRAALGEIQSRQFDIAVIDDESDQLPVIEFIQLLRHYDIELPVILLSGSDSEQLASEAVRSGAAEFVFKDDAYYHKLPRLVGETLRRRVLIERNHEMEERLKAREYTDPVAITSATLAHEINNPLMAILGATELLLGSSHSLDSDIRSKLDVIHDSALRIRRCLSVLTSLSNFSFNHTASGSLIELPHPVSADRDRS